MSFKIFKLFLFGQLIIIYAFGQPPSLAEMGDTSKFKSRIDYIGKNFFSTSPLRNAVIDSILAGQLGQPTYSVMNFVLQAAGEANRGMGNFALSLDMQFEALRLNRKQKDHRREAYTFSFLGFTFQEAGIFREALNYLLPAKPVLDRYKDWIQSSFTCSNTAQCYTMLGMVDSAKYFNSESKRIWDSIPDGDIRKKALYTLISNRIGHLHHAQREFKDAATYYHFALDYAIKNEIEINKSMGFKNLALVMSSMGIVDSAKLYAWNAISLSKQAKQKLIHMESASILLDLYKAEKKTDSAFYYQSLLMSLNDSIYGQKKTQELWSNMLLEQENKQKREVEQASFQNRMSLFLLGFIAVSLLGIALILRRNNMQKQNINVQLNDQKASLEKTLKELYSTQAQLIQSEKMASLGELTAGIAHEIQNPLNFVNNFSEVNKELILELKQEMTRGNYTDAESIALDIMENEKKINHHGKRADSIVKSMLQHSKSGSGIKEPTDINALADECLRLAYQGFKAKDKFFNVNLKTSFDPRIGSVNIVPHEISRVFLNLINNAFYSVNEKMKSADKWYEPKVIIKTSLIQAFENPLFSQSSNSLIISVMDNGNGIPEKIRDKIFQPFFTTKPTGQGTGLGLSLSYDIIKAHQGVIDIMNTHGEGAEFIITLPVIV